MDYCGRAQNAAEKSSEASAREKLELVLMQLAADKYSDKDYNKDGYIDKTLTENGMQVTDDDIVIVDNWKFEIDRETLQIVDSYGKEVESQEIRIRTAEELVAFREKVNNGETFEGKTIKLMNDIDLKLSNVCGEGIGNWIPIGDYASDENLYFGGTFDGNNHTINNLYVNDSSKGYQGLFGNVKNGEIRNLNVNGNVTGKNVCGRNSRNY